MKIAVLGPGAWGTTLAKIAQEDDHAVTLWGNPERLEAIACRKENTKYLPGIALPENWQLEADYTKAITKADCVIIAVPSNSFRVVAKGLNNFSGITVTATKGIEHETGLTMSGILHELAPKSPVVALSGPSLAKEVARGIPTALVCASVAKAAATTVQDCFHRPKLRVYTSSDVLGVELGGALKNVIAIAAGVCDGLKLGDNAKAALITRGLNEIRRFGRAAGAQSDTFNGLSCMGDLTVTCFSKLSRNRTLGERIAKGEALDDILITATAEGYPATKSAHALAQRLNVITPIINEVYAMLYEGKDVRRTVTDLMTRNPKAES